MPTALGCTGCLPKDFLSYLPQLVSGEWMGTMHLTEPQAGSDVGALRTKAVAAGDGAYRLTGEKVFITYGEHDLTENIIHVVLARLADAPAGTKGLSVFLVPKRLVNADGSLGERNDVRAQSIVRPALRAKAEFISAAAEERPAERDCGAGRRHLARRPSAAQGSSSPCKFSRACSGAQPTRPTS